MTQEVKIKLEDLVEGLDEPQWEECPALPGWELRLRVPEAPELLALTSRLMVDPDSGEMKVGKPLNDAEAGDLHFSRARLAIMDWRGLTVAGLKTLVPQVAVVLAQAEENAFSPEQTVNFSPQIRDLLLRRSMPVLGFVVKWLTRQEGLLEEAGKNFSATPSTTPTPTPGPAKGAGQKKKSSA